MKTLVVFVFAAMFLTSTLIAATGQHIKKATLQNKSGVTIATGDVNGDGKIIISTASLSADKGNATLIILTTNDGKQIRVAVGDVTGDGAAEYAVTSPRDAASGQATGKSASTITSPRDPASGQASGRSSGMGVGKVSLSDLHFVVNTSSGVIKASSSTDAQNRAKSAEGSIAVSIKRNGDTIEVLSWSFGASNPSGR